MINQNCEFLFFFTFCLYFTFCWCDRNRVRWTRRKLECNILNSNPNNSACFYYYHNHGTTPNETVAAETSTTWVYRLSFTLLFQLSKAEYDIECQKQKQKIETLPQLCLSCFLSFRQNERKNYVNVLLFVCSFIWFYSVYHFSG